MQQTITQVDDMRLILIFPDGDDCTEEEMKSGVIDLISVFAEIKQHTLRERKNHHPYSPSNL